VGGAVQHAHLPGAATRPGPRPVSARQAAAIGAQNARIQREVAQTLAECQREVAASNRQLQRRAQSLPFGQYDPDRRPAGSAVYHEAIQLPGTYREVDVTRYAAGSLWIYATSLHDGWGDRQYFVYNPQTGAILRFTPEASIAADKRLYASRRARIQGTAAGTGVAGGYLEKGFLGVGAVFLTGGMALELGAYAFVAEEVAPVATRVAVQAYRLVQPYAKTALMRAKDGFLVRAGTDLTIQLGGGFVMGKGSVGARASQAISGVNGTSLVLAGTINTAGIPLSRLAKWLVPASTAAVSNGFTVNGDNFDKYGSYGHLVDLTNGQEASKYAFNIILGTLLDRGREVLTESGTESLVRAATSISGQAQRAASRWMTETRVSLGLNLYMGVGFELNKKGLEQVLDSQQAPAPPNPASKKPTSKNLPSGK
jgi:hypothetical protein